MKRTYKLKVVAFSLMTMGLLSSCLKDNRYIPFVDDTPVVDFAVTALAGTAQTTATLLQANATNSVNALISVGAQHDYTSATTVTVIVDATGVPAGGVLLPASTYTVAGLTASINPGVQQRISNMQPIVGAPLALPNASQGMVSFVVNTAAYQALDQTKTYYLPLTITSASGNSAVVDQYNKLIFKMAIK